MAGQDVIYTTDFTGLEIARRGKVRDVYIAGENLVLVATDRLSAFDVVFSDPIPQKGKVLNQLAAFWFGRTRNIVPNHLLSTKVADMPSGFHRYEESLAGRSCLVRKSVPFRLECIVRGYLVGSGWSDYKKTGSVCGVKLPSGLLEASKLDDPIFTPTTKEETGHDISVDAGKAAHIAGGAEIYSKIEEYSIKLYQYASQYAEKRGIIIADTKFEFGIADDQVILIDEALTPDSSRFWPAESYKTGSNPPSYDKQFVRDYVTSIGWDKTPPAPRLPKDVIEKTTAKYVEAYESLTGKKLE